MKIGCTINPTAKSDTARLERSVFAGEPKEGVFQIAINVARFPSKATGQRKTFTTKIAIVKYSSLSFSMKFSCRLEFEEFET